MATTFTITAEDIINITLRKLGVNIQGGTATTTQRTEALQALNIMARRFFTKGMPFYREFIYEAPMVANQRDYTIPTDKLYNIYQAFTRETSTTIDIPVRVISREEYNSFTNKTAIGRPVIVTIGKDQDTYSLYPTPDAISASTYVLRLYGYHQEDVYTAGSDNILFPSEWQEALIYGLCVRLAPEYGVDLDEQARLKSMADQALEDAVNYNPQEYSVYFGVTKDGWS